MLGGGTWTSQNKELPGTYINVISVSNANAKLSDRGVCTMPLELDWGPSGVFTVESGDLINNSIKLFGYDYTDEKLKPIREIFLNAKTLYAYRLNAGGTYAENTYAKAKYTGIVGNNIKIQIQSDLDNDGYYSVKTYVGTVVVDEQLVNDSKQLIANDFVTFKTFSVQEVAGAPLTGGENGNVSGASHQDYLKKIESYNYNTMGVAVTDDTTKKLYVAFCKRLRDEMGKKFQLIMHDHGADYYGVISIKNKVKGANEASLVFWLTGAECACPVNQTCESKKYDGEYEVIADYTQAELIKLKKEGHLLLHNVDDAVEVLEDINTHVTLTPECDKNFQSNQTIRVIDQLGNDDALLFNSKYRGKFPNTQTGRTALWADLAEIRNKLQAIDAIENFSKEELTVERGEEKGSVVVIGNVTPVNMMSKLYMTTKVIN